MRQVYQYFGFPLTIDLSLRQCSLFIHLIIRAGRGEGGTVGSQKASVSQTTRPWRVTLLLRSLCYRPQILIPEKFAEKTENASFYLKCHSTFYTTHLVRFLLILVKTLLLFSCGKFSRHSNNSIKIEHSRLFDFQSVAKIVRKQTTLATDFLYPYRKRHKPVFFFGPIVNKIGKCRQISVKILSIKFYGSSSSSRRIILCEWTDGQTGRYQSSFSQWRMCLRTV